MKLPFQSAHVGNHGIHVLWWETMPETRLVDLDRRHLAAAQADLPSQLIVCLVLHLWRGEARNRSVEEFASVLIAVAVRAMTFGAGQIEGLFSGDGAGRVQAETGTHQHIAFVVFRDTVEKQAIGAGHPYFGKDAASIRLVKYERAVAKKFARPTDPCDDVRAKPCAGFRLHVEPKTVH